MRSLSVFVVSLVLCVGTASAQDFITGTSTASEILDPGPTQGWYQYDMDIQWDFTLAGQGAGLSHWDIVLTLCTDLGFDVVFPDPAGTSTGENSPADPTAILWFAEWLPEGDPVIVPPITDPIIKYDQVADQLDDAGNVGFGTFSFIMNSAPLPDQTHADTLVGKFGNNNIFGDLTGAYPDCDVPIPEPTSLALLAAGLLLGVRRKGRPV